jgi:hypothetical protein
MRIIISMRIVIFKNRSILNKSMAKQMINHSILETYSVNQMGYKLIAILSIKNEILEKLEY